VGGVVYSYTISKAADVAQLAGCTGIGKGDLTIKDTTDVTSLAGLESLTHIDGVLLITGNQALADVDGLRNLTVIGGGVKLYDNPVLGRVSLAALASVGLTPAYATELDIDDNATLDLVDLPALASLGNSLNIDGLTTPEVRLPSLATVPGRAVIRTRGALTLPSLTRVGKDLDISGDVQSFSLPALTEVGGALTPASSGQPTSFSAPLLSRVGTLYLKGPLTTVELGALERVDKSLSFDGLRVAALGAPALRDVGGTFYVFANSELASIVFTALATVGGDFVFKYNQKLPTAVIEALARQVAVSGQVIIENNGP
jgi:hypothetical protein